MKSKRTSILASLIAFSAALGSRSSAVAVAVQCEIVPNGHFEFQTKGWSIDSIEDHEGDAWAFASVDHVPQGKSAFGTGALQFSAVAATQYEWPLTAPQTSAAAIATASAIVPITGRYLTLQIAGGFEADVFGSANHTLLSRLEVLHKGEVALTRNLATFGPHTGFGCDLGLSVLGAFPANPPVFLDVLGSDAQTTGLKLNDEVELRITLQAFINPENTCSGGSVQAIFQIDNVRFCDPPKGYLPGDLNLDGQVNVDDLVDLLAQWGFCTLPEPLCTGDIAPVPFGNGIVDVDDLVVLLGNWQ